MAASLFAAAAVPAQDEACGAPSVLRQPWTPTMMPRC